MEIWSKNFQVLDNPIGSNLIDLCKIRLGDALIWKLRDPLSTGFQVQHVDRVTTSLRAGFWVPILSFLALGSVYVDQGIIIGCIGS